jgi:hypothetical protein
MTLRNFLKLHQDGTAMGCVSVHLLPYDHEKNGYTKTYFEEDRQEKIETSELFKEIRGKQVHHFNIIGGGMYPVELCIYLEEEQ